MQTYCKRCHINYSCNLTTVTIGKGSCNQKGDSPFYGELDSNLFFMKNGGNYIDGITGLQYGKLNITVFTKHLHDSFTSFCERKGDIST